MQIVETLLDRARVASPRGANVLPWLHGEAERLEVANALLDEGVVDRTARRDEADRVALLQPGRLAQGAGAALAAGDAGECDSGRACRQQPCRASAVQENL